ncbi:MAG: RdgB/HAM1 family non-canonical purine NTP pyrophosphatase [Polyangiaceae bacterium]
MKDPEIVRPERIALVVATSNRGKLEELRLLLAGLPVDVHALGDVVAGVPAVVEDGDTFAENATKKARAAGHATGMLTLADDSGLEVDALGGRPGVRSARFAGEDATDAENCAALLEALARSGKPPPYRARFRCVLALVDGHSPGVRTVEGACQGTITVAPRGAGGFGYDPLFVPEGMAVTMAQLSRTEKNRISHRAHALEALRPLLEGRSRRLDLVPQ